MSRRNQPYLPLYVKDYLTDEKVNQCSAATQGIYIKIMCVLHSTPEYGAVILPKQKSSTRFDFACYFARQLGFEKAEIDAALAELLDFGVLRLEAGRLFQPRMVRDAEISELRAKSGSEGGKKRVKNMVKEGADYALAKTKKNAEIANENDNEDVIESKKGKGGAGGKGKKRPILFRESPLFDKAEFARALQQDERYAQAHIDYYHEIILNWSDQQNRKIDWLATTKNWILRDLQRGQFVDKNFNPNKSRYGSKNEEALRHGIDQLERIKSGKL